MSKPAPEPTEEELQRLWARHHAEWRDTAQVASQWREAANVDPRLLRMQAQGAWWDVLAALDVTLLVTREYEHLLMALQVSEGKPCASYMPLPHPSGLAVDWQRGIVAVASTRNPNQVYDLAPVTGVLPRQDMRVSAPPQHPLVPVRSRFLPGSLYMHDLAVVGGTLYANAVGHNAVVHLADDGTFRRVWWPRCIETDTGPVFERNHLQLNSIAAGASLAESYFSASAAHMSARRPGHKNFPVDGRGVIFSGDTREPVASGLTRPHSARLHEGRLWVDNSGYGEVGTIEDGHFRSVARLAGWTRGLCFSGHVAFVGTSRVIPRFRHYAPGLDVATSRCAVHALDMTTGRLLGSLTWTHGNQLFALDVVPRSFSKGFPFQVGAKRMSEPEKQLFYAFCWDKAGDSTGDTED